MNKRKSKHVLVISCKENYKERIKERERENFKKMKDRQIKIKSEIKNRKTYEQLIYKIMIYLNQNMLNKIDRTRKN